MSKSRVSYFYDPDLGAMSYGYNAYMKPFRMRMTHNLICSYQMLDKMTVLRAKRATALDMTAFHTDEYIDFLSRVTPETCAEMLAGRDFLAPELDNPAWDGVWDFCQISAGGSIDAASRIASGASEIAINWAGGLHHAKKRSASGFCYVNDIVLCILELLRTYTRVLYIDIDVHHGDGVEEAFLGTDRVLTFSLHKFGHHQPFFPGTGAVRDTGQGEGRGYSINVPLHDGVSDEVFTDCYEFIVQRIMDWYQPGAVVLQCGADSLAGDRLGGLNLSMEGHARCVEFIKSFNVPVILLGGGGYTVRNVVRTWTYETACALGIQHEIDRDLPFCDYFEWFGPRYRLEVPPTNMEDRNLHDGYLSNIKLQIAQLLKDLPFAPSVGQQQTPREPVAVSTKAAKRMRSPFPDERAYVPADADEVIEGFMRAAQRKRARTGAFGTREREGRRHGAAESDEDDATSEEEDDDDEENFDRRAARNRRVQKAAAQARSNATAGGLAHGEPDLANANGLFSLSAAIDQKLRLTQSAGTGPSGSASAGARGMTDTGRGARKFFRYEPLAPEEDEEETEDEMDDDDGGDAGDDEAAGDRDTEMEVDGQDVFDGGEAGNGRHLPGGLAIPIAVR